MGRGILRELSIYVDESGSFGKYEPHCPYYIVTLVFHDQSVDISANLTRLKESMSVRGLPDYTVHAGPLIRREDEYRDFHIEERKKIFDNLFHFIRTADITYHSCVVEKKMLVSEIGLNIQITKQLSTFLVDNFQTFSQYRRSVIYYDYGQMELTNILATAFTAILGNVEFRKAKPSTHKLFQAADMFCTLELLALKAEKKILSNSELTFFSSARNLKKSYLRIVKKKRFR